MKITNKYNYPEALVEAVRRINDDYDMKDDKKISVTSLIDSPYRRMLKIQYKDILYMDVSDCIWQLFGSAIHYVIEKSSSNAIKEVRLESDFAGQTISGKFDLYDPDTKCLQDWKVTSKYAVKEVKKEWECQLNVLKLLIEMRLGLKVEKLQINAILRDFNKHDRFKQELPDYNVVSLEVPIWTDREVMDYVYDRLRMHLNPTPCTDEERWREPSVYAVHKTNADKASKLCITMSEALEWIAAKKDSSSYEIRFRQGKDKRCDEYCELRDVCPEYRANLITTLEEKE